MLQIKDTARDYFQTLPVDVLVAIANGQLDAVELVKAELKSRYLNEQGEWIGVKSKAVKLRNV